MFRLGGRGLHRLGESDVGRDRLKTAPRGAPQAEEMAPLSSARKFPRCPGKRTFERQGGQQGKPEVCEPSRNPEDDISFVGNAFLIRT